MNNTPLLRTRASAFGLAALLSLGALACAGDSSDSQVLGGDATAGALSSDASAIDVSAEGHGDHDHDDHSSNHDGSGDGNHDHAADVQTHAAVMGLVEVADATHVAATSLSLIHI